MSDTKTAPFPWRIECEEPYCPELLDSNGERVKGIKLWEDDADYPGGDLNDRNRANFAALLARVNTHDQLLAACEAALAYIPGSEVRSWPPGFELKKRALELLRSAIANARGGK